MYKRLKFLGNREISQFAALLFLAVWHGLHTGILVNLNTTLAALNCTRNSDIIHYIYRILHVLLHGIHRDELRKTGELKLQLKTSI